MDEGELNIFVNTPNERKLVQHRAPGDSFGELALIYNTPRAADVVVSALERNRKILMGFY